MVAIQDRPLMLRSWQRAYQLLDRDLPTAITPWRYCLEVTLLCLIGPFIAALALWFFLGFALFHTGIGVCFGYRPRLAYFELWQWPDFEGDPTDLDIITSSYFVRYRYPRLAFGPEFDFQLYPILFIITGFIGYTAYQLTGLRLVEIAWFPYFFFSGSIAMMDRLGPVASLTWLYLSLFGWLVVGCGFLFGSFLLKEKLEHCHHPDRP